MERLTKAVTIEGSIKEGITVALIQQAAGANMPPKRKYIKYIYIKYINILNILKKK